MIEQLSINFAPEPATDDQVQILKRILSQRGWMSRKALIAALDWSERTIRNVAEAAGADIVRGPLGFTVFESATNAEVEHAAKISISQGDKMKQYGTALLKRLAARPPSTASQPTEPSVSLSSSPLLVEERARERSPHLPQTKPGEGRGEVDPAARPERNPLPFYSPEL